MRILDFGLNSDPESAIQIQNRHTMSAQRAQDPTAPGPAPASDPSTSSPRIPPPDEQSPAQAFADVKIRVQELSEYAGYLISAKMDGIKLAVRNAGIYAALGVVGAL